MNTLGFTGSRKPPTEAQLRWLWQAVCCLRKDFVFHHGGCVGADAAFHRLALKGWWSIVIHSPVDTKLMMPEIELNPYRQSNPIMVLPPKPYLARNRDIVDAVTRMCALPDGFPRPHSGTWYTIEYALRRGVDIIACYPDGTVETRFDLERRLQAQT